MKGKITIVGLGSSDENHLSLGVYRLFKKSNNIYLRTRIHPVVDFFISEAIPFRTFDHLYDTLSQYEAVYKEISDLLIHEAMRGENVVYAVPGHPMVAERSVKLLIENSKDLQIELEIIGGESFLDTFFTSLHIDPIEGFMLLNAETITKKDLNTSKNTVIGQVYNRFVASDLKLTLLEVYPPEMNVCVVSNLGMGSKEVIKEIALYELDHHEENFHHLSSVFVPKIDEQYINNNKDFSRLVEIVDILRSPNGCPWDREQTHQSIRKNLIEETYELAETIDDLDMNHMVEELGDVLLQVLLHSQIAAEEGYFTIDDVIENLNQKLIRRHPHVFGDKEANEADEALNHWENMKKQERGELEEDKSILGEIPVNLPAILKAYKLQKKAAEVKFDWDNIEDVYAKIEEEISELKAAEKKDQLEEVGDVIFAVVNLARFLKIDAEEALAKTNKKFIKRFNYIEKKLKENNLSFHDVNLDVMEGYWKEAKHKQ